MRSIWNRKPTPSPIAVGEFVGNEEDGYQLYRNGAYYAAPNSLLGPAPGVAALSLDFGFGQSVVLEFGGFRSAPPAP